MIKLPKGNLIRQQEMASRNTFYNQQTAYQNGSRAQSYTNQTQKMGSRLNDMNIDEHNQSNLSYMTGGDLNEAQMHSKSQIIQYSKNSSTGQFAPPSHQKRGNQVINLNSYEVRKQSLQDLKSQNIRMMGGQNGQNYKFRNQLQQFSSDNDGVTPNNESNLFLSNPNTNGNIINSMSIKNDALFQNRGGVLNRVKTQDASTTENMVK